jgi:hypothetical protein
MWILFVEMFVALSLFILIVWWTMRSRKPNQPVQNTPDLQQTKQPDSSQ